MLDKEEEDLAGFKKWYLADKAKGRELIRARLSLNIHCKVDYDLHIQHCIDPKPYFATRRQDQMNNRGSVIMKACMKM